MTARQRSRLDDLAAPRLTDRQRAAIAAAAAAPPTLSVPAVLDAARRDSGLDDFGPADFQERLAVWMAAGRADEGLNDFGRAVLFGYARRYAAQRAHLQALLRRAPALGDEAVVRPVFIAGLPRSGTTRLVNLLSLDRRWRTLPYWEAVEPFGVRGAPDTRRARCSAAWRDLDALLPHLKAMHEMSPDHVHEDLELMALDFTTYNIEWTAHVPAWRDWYLAHDRRPHYRFLKRALQALQWQDREAGQPARRWLLKCPQHLENLLPLLETFPDATLVLTHREPADVIVSAATVVTYGDRLCRHRPQPHETGAYWCDRIERMLDACLADLPRLPAAQWHSLPFERFVADEVGALRQVYALAGEPLDEALCERFSARRDAGLDAASGSIAYDPEGDFGLSRAALNERFARYRSACLGA